MIKGNLINTFILILIIGLTGWKSESSIKMIKVNEFPINRDLTYIKKSTNQAYKHLWTDIKLIDKYIVLVDRKSKSALHFIDKENFNYLFSKISIGGGENNISLAGPLQVKGNYLMLVDIIKKQLYQYDIRKLDSTDLFIPEKKYNIPINGITDGKYINPNRIIASGGMENGRVCLYDSAGLIIQGIGSIPDSCPDNHLFLCNIRNKFRIELFPNNRDFLISSMYSDKLQIFINNIERININGPDSINRDFHFQIRACMLPSIKFGYIDVVVKDKYIYGLYSGNLRDVKQVSSVLVFKHNGDPVARFTLDKYVKSFDVDEEKNLIYAINFNPNGVYMYSFDIWE